MSKTTDFFKKGSTIIIILETVAIIILSLWLQCRGRDCHENGNTTDTITHTVIVPGDSIPYIKYLPKPYPVYYDTGKVVVIPADIDSFAVALAYFTELRYDMILRDDTSMFCEYKFSVWMNQMQPGEFISLNRRPLQTTTTTITNNIIQERKFKMYIGGSVGGSMNSFELSAGLLFQYKSFLTGAQYGFFQKSITIPVYYKLHFKDKKK